MASVKKYLLTGLVSRRDHFYFLLHLGGIMVVVRRREEVGAVVLPVAVIEGQQIGHGLVSLCVF